MKIGMITGNNNGQNNRKEPHQPKQKGTMHPNHAT